jgi:hypothetical protein
MLCNLRRSPILYNTTFFLLHTFYEFASLEDFFCYVISGEVSVEVSDELFFATNDSMIWLH